MRSFGANGGDNHSTQASEAPHKQQRQTHGKNVGTIERWGSALGGAILGAYGLKRRSLGGAALALLGGGLVYRGIKGYCPCYQALDINTSGEGEATQLIEVEKAITIDKSPDELYRFWRHFENLPRFMAHLKSVQSLDHRRLHWAARAPLGMTAEWDAEITEERDNEFIAWRSLEGSRIPNQGCVRFRRAPGGRGTEVHITLAYRPPLGKLGATVAKLFGEEPTQQLDEDLRRFKCLMETGEIPTIEGQPSVWVSTRREELSRQGQQSLRPSLRGDVVEESSKRSSPASDAPAWTSRDERV
jgi:uncharacterized membrane protein